MMQASDTSSMTSMIKQMMMTTFIFKNANGPQQHPMDYLSFIYIFIATQLVEWMTTKLPRLMEIFLQKFYKDLNKRVESISTSVNIEKKSSIILNVNMNDIENTLGKALIDHITHIKSIKKLYYTERQFILNQKDEIMIDDDIYAQIVNTNIDSLVLDVKKEKDPAIQVIEVFSYTKLSSEVREFLNNIQKNYVTNTQNRLGTRRFYFTPLDI